MSVDVNESIAAAVAALEQIAQTLGQIANTLDLIEAHFRQPAARLVFTLGQPVKQ